MFVVDITIWPHGNFTRPDRRTRIAVANDGYGTRDVGNYSVWNVSPDLADADVHLLALTTPPEARVLRFPRGDSQAHLPALTAACIQALGLDEIKV